MKEFKTTNLDHNIEFMQGVVDRLEKILYTVKSDEENIITNEDDVEYLWGIFNAFMKFYPEEVTVYTLLNIYKVLLQEKINRKKEMICRN